MLKVRSLMSRALNPHPTSVWAMWSGGWVGWRDEGGVTRSLIPHQCWRISSQFSEKQDLTIFKNKANSSNVEIKEIMSKTFWKFSISFNTKSR